jgi:hypothetical protein
MNGKLQNVGEPQTGTDAATKNYVDSMSGKNWSNYKATSDIDMSGNTIKNAFINANVICPPPVLSADNTLVLTGNNSSSGIWVFRMTKDIDSFQISQMPNNAQYHLMIRGDSTTEYEINFCGGGVNYIYTTWSSPITVGPRTYLRLQIHYTEPDYLISMTGYT